MKYIDGFVVAVANANKAKFFEHAAAMAKLFKQYGALEIVDCWGDDVPQGKLTSFPMAVQCREDETVVFSWIVWTSKAARDQAWEKLMQDPQMNSSENPMPFDGKRMIYGGFSMNSVI